MAKKGPAGAVSSMTGFASLSGDSETVKWDWEIRSVNGKGLDMRLRLPEGAEALERPLRTAASACVSRGNVTISLRISETHSAGVSIVNGPGLEAALESLDVIAGEADRKNVLLAPLKATDIAAMPGVMTTATRDKSALPEAIAAQIPELLETFSQMRTHEGAALCEVLKGQLATVDGLVEAAQASAEARQARQGDILRERVKTLLDTTEIAEPARINQELALLAVKSDVTEEIDRLNAHVKAAHGLLDGGGAVGRKLDFLMQEFNREANTLCSKSGTSELTSIGLELKVLIDQMREQVQNLE